MAIKADQIAPEVDPATADLATILRQRWPGATTYQMAEKLGVSQTHVRDLLRGAVTRPHALTLRAISRRLRMTEGQVLSALKRINGATA